MVTAVASTVEAYAFTSLAGEPLEHIGADALVARTVERELRTLRVGSGLIPQRLEARHTFLRHGVVLIDHTGFDGVKEAVSRRILALSMTALGVLDHDQLATIEGSSDPVALDIPTIEKAGGSVPCTLAGIHLLSR